MRDRAADLLAEEADLAKALAKTWGAADADGDDGFPSLHLGFDRLLAQSDVPAWTVTTAPEGPDVATITSMGVAVAAGDPERVVRQLAELQADGYRIVVAADGEGSAARVRELLSQHGRASRGGDRQPRAGLHPARHQAGRDRRTRPHRPPAVAPQGPAAQARLGRLLRRPEGRRPRRAPPARRGSLRRHGEAGHRRGGARLPAARVQGRRQALRARPTRSTPCATTPAATRPP